MSTAAARSRYPRKAEIARAIDAAKSCGLDVAGIELSPSGMIRIVEARAVPVVANDFDRYADQL